MADLNIRRVDLDPPPPDLLQGLGTYSILVSLAICLLGSRKGSYGGRRRSMGRGLLQWRLAHRLGSRADGKSSIPVRSAILKLCRSVSTRVGDDLVILAVDCFLLQPKFFAGAIRNIERNYQDLPRKRCLKPFLNEFWLEETLAAQVELVSGTSAPDLLVNGVNGVVQKLDVPSNPLCDSRC